MVVKNRNNLLHSFTSIYLSGQVQQAIMEAGAEAVKTQRKVAALLEQEALEDLRATGMKINEIINRTDFTIMVEPVYEQFEASIGSDLLKAARQKIIENQIENYP